MFREANVDALHYGIDSSQVCSNNMARREI
jgi:hypothetical protein